MLQVLWVSDKNCKVTFTEMHTWCKISLKKFVHTLKMKRVQIVSLQNTMHRASRSSECVCNTTHAISRISFKLLEHLLFVVHCVTPRYTTATLIIRHYTTGFPHSLDAVFYHTPRRQPFAIRKSFGIDSRRATDIFMGHAITNNHVRIFLWRELHFTNEQR